MLSKILTITIDKNRVFGLDILRAIAILLVMITHTSNFLPRPLQIIINKFNFDGVSVFFVLSGFLIGGILLNELNKSTLNFSVILNFWVKRWSRTLPNYYLYLIISIFLIPIISKGFELKNLIPYIFFLQNTNTNVVHEFYSHSWSLSVEEWFYLLIPLLIFTLVIITKISVKNVFLISALAILISISFLRIIYFNQNQPFSIEDYVNVRYSVIYRFDSLMYGMIGAYIYKYHSTFWNKYRFHFLILSAISFLLYYALIISGNFDYEMRSNFIFILVSLIVLLSLPYLSNLKKSNSKWVTPITYISLISYSLYLSNSIVIEILDKQDWTNIVTFLQENIYPNYIWTIVMMFNFLLGWALPIICSIITYKYYEIPTTNFFRKKIKF